MFGDPEDHRIKMIVEKKFDHKITATEQIEMTNYISKLGNYVYTVTKEFTFNVSNQYKTQIK